MSPALNGSTALQRFERGNAVEIRNGIMFNFYPGLPQMYSELKSCEQYQSTHAVYTVLSQASAHGCLQLKHQKLGIDTLHKEDA